MRAPLLVSEDDADRLARMGNETEFGLSATIWTRDIGMAHRLARRLKAGTIRINGSGGVDPALPLGGYKASGWGRENGKAGIEAYTELKSGVGGAGLRRLRPIILPGTGRGTMRSMVVGTRPKRRAQVESPLRHRLSAGTTSPCRGGT